MENLNPNLCIDITFGQVDGKITHIKGAPFDGTSYLLNTELGWVQGSWESNSDNVDAVYDGIVCAGAKWVLCDGRELQYNAVTQYAILPNVFKNNVPSSEFLTGIRSAASMLFYKACNTWKPKSHGLHEACKVEAQILDAAAESVLELELELEPGEYAKWKEITRLSNELYHIQETIRETVMQNGGTWYSNDVKKSIQTLIK